jgi:hypothetical protein
MTLPAVILVAGPRLAGSTNVREQLQRQLPRYCVIEFPFGDDEGEGSQAPTVVVFVVSAAAQLVRSDCELLDRVALRTDAVIAAVSKIDVHQGWRSTLESNRALLADHHSRYATTRWVPVAAAPDFGAPRLDELLAAIQSALAETHLARRNRLQAEVAEHDTALEALRRDRRSVLRADQQAKTARSSAFRTRLQQARMELAGCAGRRCESARAEFQRGVDTVTGRTLSAFLGFVRRRAEAVVEEVDATA